MPLSVLKVLEVLCSKIAIVAALLMALVIFVDVVGRTVFDAPLGFSYEVVSISLAIMFYSGLYHVHKTKGHITIDLLDKFYVGPLARLFSGLSI